MRSFGPLRISRDRFDRHPAYEPLLAAAAGSGRCPVLLSELGLQRLDPPADPAAAVAAVARLDPAEVLAQRWPGECYPWCACREPFGAEFPGLVPPIEPVEDPSACAVRMAGEQWRMHLAVVPVARPADVVAAIGWQGAANLGEDVAALSAVLRSWADRFGATLVGIDAGTLWLSVAAPPRTDEQCLRIAAEHFAFCPDVDGEDPRPLRVYASTLCGRDSWRFWWD